MDMRTIKEALSDELAAHLAPITLSELLVSESTDHDGDPVIRLRAVYDEKKGTPSGAQVFEAFGVVCDRLDALGESRFPLLTFISLGDLNAEAA